MEELISVVVSVFNVEDYLPQCLDSLSKQTYQNLEILLIDDGSTDGSGVICDAFAARDARARVIHQNNLGLWAVRNKGQAESLGAYILFPDGDDYFHKDYIRFLYEAINYNGIQHPLAICGFKGTLESEEDTLSEKRPSYIEMTQPQLLAKITSVPTCGEAFWGANWNKLYRKSVLPTPFQRNYLRCQDYDSNLRFFFSINDAVVVDSILYYWRMHPRQSTKAQQYNQIRNECRTRIFLSALSDIPKSLTYYQSFLLQALYTRLVLWKESSLGTELDDYSRRMIQQAQRKTLGAFLTCPYVPISTKIHLLFALHFPKRKQTLSRIIHRFR